MRRLLAAAALGAAVVGSTVTGAQASPWVPDPPRGPCPYAGCDTWPVPDTSFPQDTSAAQQ